MTARRRPGAVRRAVARTLWRLADAANRAGDRFDPPPPIPPGATSAAAMEAYDGPLSRVLVKARSEMAADVRRVGRALDELMGAPSVDRVREVVEQTWGPTATDDDVVFGWHPDPELHRWTPVHRCNTGVRPLLLRERDAGPTVPLARP